MTEDNAILRTDDEAGIPGPTKKSDIKHDLDATRAVGGGPIPLRVASVSSDNQELRAFGLAASVHCPAGLVQTRNRVMGPEVHRHLRRGSCWETTAVSVVPAAHSSAVRRSEPEVPASGTGLPYEPRTCRDTPRSR